MPPNERSRLGRRALPCLAAVALLAACHGRERPPASVAAARAAAPASPTARVDSAPPPDGVMGSVGDLFAVVGGDPGGCPADTVAVHDDPMALVREFARRDSTGEWGRDGWAFGAVTCVETTTSDYAAVVRDYRVDSLAGWPDSVWAVVRFTPRYALGYDSTGTELRMTPDSVPVVDTARVLRTRKGWRIDRYPGGEHLTARAALAVITGLSAADRRTLEGVAGTR